MSLVIDMKTRAVLHTSRGDDEDRTDSERPAPGRVPGDCDLRLVTLEPERLEAWRRWAPGLLTSPEGDDEAG